MSASPKAEEQLTQFKAIDEWQQRMGIEKTRFGPSTGTMRRLEMV